MTGSASWVFTKELLVLADQVGEHQMPQVAASGLHT